MKFDAVVLGAGMVGTATALHLQQRGMTVALVDRKPPGSETSFGNAGLIQQDAVYPYAFPRELAQILRYATNRSLDVRYHFRAFPKLAPFPPSLLASLSTRTPRGNCAFIRGADRTLRQ